MRIRTSIAMLILTGAPLILAACNAGSHDDPPRSEMQALVDHVLDIADQVCPVIEDSAPFREKAQHSGYRVNEDRNTISITEAGLTQAMQMALGASETGMFYPELQRIVDARLPHEGIAAARQAAGDAHARLLAGQSAYSAETRALLASYGEILDAVDKLTELSASPGNNTSFYLNYPAARAVLEHRIDLYCDGVAALSPGDAGGDGPQYLASRERYLQHAADYLMSPVQQVMAPEE